MKFFLCLLCAAMLIGVISGLPAKKVYRHIPQRAYMFGGYYSNPLFNRNFNYAPQGSMSAVVTRDAVATNSFSGPQPLYPPLDNIPVDENETVERYTEKATAPPVVQYAPEPIQPVELEPEVSQEELSPANAPAEVFYEDEVAVAEEVSTEAAVVTKAPKKVPPKRKIKKPTYDEDEDTAALWPFAANKGSVPSYNAFFPITISGGAPSRTRSGAEDDYYPGSATAIANAFSTGKGGVATSHATSFGDPYLAALIRSGAFNFRSSKRPQEA